MIAIAEHVRPYHRLDDFDRIIVADRVQSFMRYAKTMRRRVPAQSPPQAIAEPAAVINYGASEPAEPQPYAPNPETGYNMLGVEIAAWLRKHRQGGRFAVVAEGIGRNKKSVRQQLERMIERGEVVKYKVEKKVYYRLAERTSQ